MAVTSLSNLITPEVFEDYGSVNKIETDRLIESGIAVNNEMLNGFVANSGGRAINVPYFSQLTFAEPTAGNDTSTDLITPTAHGAKKDIAMRQQVNKAWSNMDLASEISGADVVQDVVNKVEGYWTTDRQKRVVMSSIGVVADSVASHSSDLVYDISAATGDAVVDANKVTGDTLIEAFATMGDRQDELTGLAVHSVVYKRLQQLNLIDYVKNSDNNVIFPAYLGKMLLVDDGLYTVSYGSPAKVKYYTMVYGAGAFALGAGMNYLLATEFDRTPAAGNGSGLETLYTRRQWMVHPQGYQFAYAGISDEAPTYAELIDAANWTRAISDRKYVKLACLISNG